MTQFGRACFRRRLQGINDIDAQAVAAWLTVEDSDILRPSGRTI